tara:strand:+ start:738 stop:1616 length:879 start_codon:yes stop_codon:yes gene_type:complete
MKPIRIATCQFPVEPDIASNLRYTLRQIRQASEQGARVVHFSECSLSGYAGVEFPDMSHVDWEELKDATRQIQDETKAAGVWSVIGSTHQLSGRHKPHNSLYLINPRGQIIDRYDKRFCTGTGGRRPTDDLSHYSPGNRPVVFTVDGIKLGLLICYDYRFPELYREYYTRGVRVLLQSFHNARGTVVDDPDYNIWRTIVPATMSCRAAENHMWISANNSTARPSRWPSFTVRPDGQVMGQLKLHRPGVLITDMDFDPDLFDAPGPWRDRVIEGTLHSGQLVDDPRSTDVTCL